MIRRLAALVPPALARRMARHGVATALLAGAFLVLAGVALAALVSPGSLGVSAARLSDTRALPESLLADALPERDADRDGLPDSLENYLYGTDPEGWNSSGAGIPDGWLVEFGFDPLSPLVRDARGAAPPPDALPPAYARGYPAAFTPPLSVYYAYGRPADYEPGVDAPWWRAAPRADPTRWDQAGTGIPTGWLLHYGLDVHGLDPDAPAPGARGNLTLREAFAHNTDPLARDTDRDGLDDWTEIHATRTDPARQSSAGTGIGDGWLLAFGLSPFDATVASQDPDRDGLTNLEEYVYSAEKLRAQAADDPAVVWTQGLDPLDWQTAATGIPDGWYVRYGLDPFGGELDRVIARASDFPEARGFDEAPEGFEPLPDFTMTLRDAYGYGRPTTWDEGTMGVWWGGTNPATGDTDDDGLPDPIEIRGWFASVTFETGAEAKPRWYKATSNPLEPDSDGDGLTDGEEYRGRVQCPAAQVGAPARVFPHTDPRNRDTAFSGLTDFEKACGVVRGDARYDFPPGAEGEPRLDPTRADSAGDGMRDGPRLDFWHARARHYAETDRYPYPGSAYRTLFEWTGKHARFAGMSEQDVVRQFRPDGDADGDGVANLLDADPSGGLVADKAGPGTPRTKVFFAGGAQMDPSLYKATEFASSAPRVASDPANPDTDGDGLPDAWEVRYGRFDPARSGWDLDPAKADSDGDGVTDDKANNDGDVVTWYAYNRRGGAIERVASQWSFDNHREHLAGTDPGEASTAGDGVPDGWKAFWGSRVSEDTYPNLVGAEDARIGDVALERLDEIRVSLARSPIQPLADLEGRASKEGGYVRFPAILLGADRTPDRCASLLGHVQAGETALRTSCFEGENLTGTAVRILPVEGVHVLSHADEARLRTNPHLQDSDGDGVPDAYEAYHMGLARGRTHPDPALPDGARDLDGDGLPLLDECRPQSLAEGLVCTRHTFRRDGQTHGAGADPFAPDSDGDGISDLIEATALLNLLDPSDLDSFRDPTRDADGDRVPDYQELTGWGKASFGVLVRTSPQDVDSDGDGLLDGPSLTLRPATDAARIAQWKALGMAHSTGAEGSVTFLGENTTYQAVGSLPDRRDSSDTGIPDAWFAYHLADPREPGVDLDAYKAGRPAWWDETKHGVWWWGRVPGALDAPADADGDGLHDTNGEDPFPANFTNALSQGATLITDPRELEAFVKAGGAPEEIRRRAQMAGESPGDPLSARGAQRVNPNGVPVALDRARVALTDVRLVNAPQNVVTKGLSFVVTGRVVLDERDGSGNLLAGTPEAPVGVPDRAVLVSFLHPDPTRVVGAGFTDAQGRFRIEANLSGEVRADVPKPGLVLLGATKGTAAATFDPALVGAGDFTAGMRNALVAWTTNTSATLAPGHPAYGTWQALLPDAQGNLAVRETHATRFAASDPIPVTVRSDTRLTTTLADAAQNGGHLVGDVVLTDASGGPVRNARISLRWTGAPVPWESVQDTDRTGRVNLTNLRVPVSVQRPDQYALTATYAATDANLRGSSLTHTLRVRSPTLLDAKLDRAGATIGETVLLEGRLATRDVNLSDGQLLRGAPVGGATVLASLGGVDASTRTDDQGRFSLRVPVPGTLGAGAQTLLVRFPGGDRETPAEATLPLSVRRTSHLADLTRIEGPRDAEATLRGRLLDNEGEGFVGDVEASAGSVLLGRARSDEEGRFSIPFRLGLLPLGSQPLRVTYAGDLAHGPAENLTHARVTSATTLRLDALPDQVVRGDAFPLRASLLDDALRPVEAQAVHVHWRGERVATAVTDAEGRFALDVPTNASERPSLATIALEYVPPPGSVLKGSAASANLAVLAGSRLELGGRDVHRGPVPITGRLLDDEGRPLAGAPVRLLLGGVDVGEARTSRNGTFEAVRIVPATLPLGPVAVEARYEGTASLAGARAQATFHLRSPLVLEVTKLDPLVRGEKATLEARLRDDQGSPVDLPVQVSLGPHALGQALPTAGRLRAPLDVPADAPRGPATLWLNVSGDARYDPLQLALPVVVKIRPKVEVELPALAIRGFAVGGEVLLRDDQGAPLRNATFAYVLGPDAGPVTGRTDAEGRASVASVAPLTGQTSLLLTVRGGPDVVAAEYASNSMRVVGPATPVGYAALGFAALALVGLAALAVAIVLLRRRQLVEARDILQDAIEELLAGNEYQATIFLAYRRFSGHLSRHGYAEKASQTPREFADGVRKALPVGVGPLRELIRLFEEARYSDHAIGTGERDAAVESLALVRNEIDNLLGRKPAAGVAT